MKVELTYNRKGLFDEVRLSQRTEGNPLPRKTTRPSEFPILYKKVL